MADTSAVEVDQHERQSTVSLVFKRRQLLRFSGLSPGSHYSLPFFLHREDGIPVFTKLDGKHIPFCVDSEYEALDHCLLWLDFSVDLDADSTHGDESSAAIYGYLGGGQAALEVWDGIERGTLGGFPSIPKPPAEVLLVADCFDRRDARACGVPAGWKLCQGPEEATRFIPIDPLLLGQHFYQPRFSALQLNASLGAPLPLKGAGAIWQLRAAPGVALRREVRGLWATQRSRLHLRVRFQDNMAKGVPQSHWVGLSSHLGTAAVGLAPQFDQHYASVSGTWHHGTVPKFMHKNWQKSGVTRSPGWHMFEVIFEIGNLCIMVDGEPVSIGPACDCSQEATIWLASESGGCGNWSSLELLHTPLSRGTWDAGLQQVDPLSAKPWDIVSRDEGLWIMTGAGPIEQLPEPIEQPPQEEVAEPEVEEDEEECLEVQVEELAPIEAAETQPRRRVVPPPPRRPKSRKSQRPKRQGGLSIECWSLPDETDLARLDRVIGTILDRLREANIVVPTNFARIADCEEPQHEKCYVFSFGTRRLHINMREGACGRITLAVRVGGGYMDLVEFISKNGSVEQLRLQQAQGGDAHHARFCSVLSKGRRQLKDM